MNTQKTTIAILAAVAFWFAGTPVGAQQDGGQDPTQQSGAMHQAGSSKGPLTDKQFAKRAAAGGMAEVRLGQLAQDKGQSDTVKNFGKQMVDDHSKANDQLKSTAAQENIQLPNDLNAHGQAVYSSLSQLSGAEFDKAYARDMVKDHRQDVAEFKDEASNGQDQAIKDFASQTLPTLMEHLKMARQMLHEVDPASVSQKPSGNQ
jgi:putative membrane protein